MLVTGSWAAASRCSTQAPSPANRSAAPSPSTTASTARSRVQPPAGSPGVPELSAEMTMRLEPPGRSVPLPRRRRRRRCARGPSRCVAPTTAPTRCPPNHPARPAGRAACPRPWARSRPAGTSPRTGVPGAARRASGCSARGDSSYTVRAGAGPVMVDRSASSRTSRPRPPASTAPASAEHVELFGGLFQRDHRRVAGGDDRRHQPVPGSGALRNGVRGRPQHRDDGPGDLLAAHRADDQLDAALQRGAQDGGVDVGAAHPRRRRRRSR